MPSANKQLPSTRDTSPSGDEFGEMYEVEVGQGDGTTSFYLHKRLASFYSGYFQAALNGNFSEAKTGVIDLPIEYAALFKRFVTWLYTQKMDLAVPEEGQTSFREICQLWYFADRHEIPLLMNEAINALRDHLVER